MLVRLAVVAAGPTCTARVGTAWGVAVEVACTSVHYWGSRAQSGGEIVGWEASTHMARNRKDKALSMIDQEVPEAGTEGNSKVRMAAEALVALVVRVLVRMSRHLGHRERDK